MHKKEIYTAGKELREAEKVLVLIHGRGGSAKEFLSLANQLNTSEFAILAPQATDFTWYPNSFLAPVTQNEPEYSSALEVLEELLEDIKETGIASENIYFAGFSQGACLTLEFVTRNAQRFGGVAAFTGGLIGDKIYNENYSGDFNGTPIFIGTGDPDPHVPVERVEDSAEILREMNANVEVKIYKNRPHTISENELKLANNFIFN
ncbi:dienelactone hydrolase family protein [Salegentibacter sp. BDJ18]|uniref:alpha/beta hydrolase n=1 Tax=Salegentibacter sp. BDJ18 TaxID=2816376 RepID=UPI001AAF12E8|nr:dienelactone hydrolase family protein [Salegentibacter sp. BDJ18]MBO2545541.1 dienelactone hydrolase family protein [Salegentibacter sp. BDJ18]|tara:strand:+ start:414 stop:1031 length:618 start_codon:yes stop_codon:yes gene_type:complete